jgi:hypothetical protein
MHDHHPRYDRPDIGVRRPGKVILSEEKAPERRGLKRLNLFILLLLLVVGGTVIYYTAKEWASGLMKMEAPVRAPRMK